MTISIQRLELKDGRVFQVSDLFPGDTRITDPARLHEQVVVGPIFLIPQVTESVEFETDEPAKTNGASDADDDEDSDVDEQLHEMPAHYEVWCVNEALYIAFFGGFRDMKGMQVDQKAIQEKMAGTTMVRLVIYADAALGHYEEWPTVVAWVAMMGRMEAQQQQQQQQQEPAQPAQAQV